MVLQGFVSRTQEGSKEALKLLAGRTLQDPAVEDCAGLLCATANAAIFAQEAHLARTQGQQLLTLPCFEVLSRFWFRMYWHKAAAAPGTDSVGTGLSLQGLGGITQQSQWGRRHT